MPRFTRAAGQWARDRQAEGILRLIVRSPDRGACLNRLHDKIDDRVVSGLLDLSYLAEKNGDLAETMAWADLAAQSSLLGGTSSGRAEALAWKARLLLDQADRTGTNDVGMIDTADQAARAALGIYAEAGSPDDILTAHQLITRIHQARGDILSALGSQLECARASAAITDQERAAATASRVASLYWCLPDEDLRGGAELLLRDVKALLATTASRRASADLLDACGNAHRLLAAEDAAFEAWSNAAAQYRDLGAPKDEFLVRARMFDYATYLGQFERARELGEACVATAPADIPDEQLADRHHLLASVYRVLDQADDAIVAYRRAIDLHLGREKGSGAASTVLLEMALLEADSGRFDDARHDLGQVTQASAHDYWLVETTLADISHRHLGDLGAAAAHAESAVRISISGLNNLTCRAHSLHQSGILHFMAGDTETAYNRFIRLMLIMADTPEPILIKVSPLYAHPVSPPVKAQSAWWAYRACEATGRQHEAASQLSLHLDLIRREPEIAFPAEAVVEADSVMLAALRAFVSGISLMHTEPLEALTHLARALAELTAPELSARIDVATGSCLLRLNDHNAAAAAFHRALNACRPGTETELELECRSGLARIAAASERHSEAYEQLTRCVQLIELYRSSFSGVEDRIHFLRDRLPIYEQLVETCVALNWRVEAFDAVQQVKSRSLVDLLAQPAHRPIDYSLEARAAGLKADGERWIAEYAGDIRRDDHGYDYLGSREHRMLERSVSQHARLGAIEEERKARGLFDKLYSQSSPLDFNSTKALLAR